ncbi:MAG: DNA-directed RNA polymerase subunit B [DPANN group archaeon]|nr:DNA-directed RNA polymerase subunit B [DPANN group archaeon]
MAEVYFNGKYVGEHESPQTLVKSLIEKRRKNILSHDMNVGYVEDRNEVQINTDSGRVRRLLIVVNDGVPLLTEELIAKLKKKEVSWDDMTAQNIVEFIDAEEEENTYIALKREDVTKDHTHLELDPVLMFGISTSILPFPEKNRGDRLNYGARMAIQAIGSPAQNYLMRDDTTMNVLVYPQVPIVDTETIDSIGLTSHPSGQNLVIAIMPFYGYNIEDAIIINKASIDRGFGRSLSYKTHVSEFRRYWGGQEDEIRVPDPSVHGYKSEEAYRDLDEYGIINPEIKVSEGSTLVGKVSPLRFLGITKEVRMGIQNFRENSLTVEKNASGYVEKVILTTDQQGNKIVKVSVRDTKIPEVGDKFATRHGQKGVIGIVVPEEDMPFTEDGTRPDVIITTHAIPSRMTVGQLLEIIAGKAGALAGKRVNGTAFKGDEAHIREALKVLGFRDDGRETMYNGITGEKMESTVLIGIGYYQKLYHLVSKKMHARSRGPVALMTKQPTEGRSKDGGLRIGEMEKDCFIAHGAPIVLRERFSSDMVIVPVCRECGVVAVDDKLKNKITCPVCKTSSKNNIVMTEMSYAFKLMLDELKSMTLYPKIIPVEK